MTEKEAWGTRLSRKRPAKVARKSQREKPQLCLNKGKAEDKESRDCDISRAAECTQETAAFAFGWIKGAT